MYPIRLEDPRILPVEAVSCETFGSKTCTSEAICFQIENEFVCQKPENSYLVPGKNCASKCKFNEQCVRNEYQFETNTHFEFTCIATDFVVNTTDNKLLQNYCNWHNGLENYYTEIGLI